MRAIIHVEPHAKGRPKVSTFGGHAQVYTPKKTRIAEADIKAAIRNKIAKAERFGAGEALVLWVTFYVVRPKSAPKRVKHPVTRPDLDNYLKTLLDALDKFAFPDDAQIVNIHAKKAFAAVGTPPRIEFILEREE
uniref:Putative endodeoxyribonuclease n=1 Tax=viral metagenome TaxID=1070528 RepID=A0A6M3M6U9_9ZZZZ